LFFYDWNADESYSAAARYLRTVSGQLSDISKKEDEIYKSTSLSAEAKRQKVTELETLKSDIARKALELYKGTAPEQIITEQLNEFVDKLGTVKDDAPELSIKPDDIYDMKNLWTNFGQKLQNVPVDVIKSVPLAVSYQQAVETQKTVDSTLNEKYIDVNADTNKGDTYREYYNQWLERSKITDPATLELFNKAYPNAYKGNFTKRELDLLNQYHSLSKDEQKQFLKDHPELSQNPRDEWLKSHPEDNARLAIWGQAKILTQSAYDKAQQMIKDLDIPDSAVVDYLPPKDIATDYFKYNDMLNEFSPSSAEVKLLGLKNPKLFEYLKRDAVTDNKKVLELQAKNRDVDPESPAYKDDMERIEALKLGADDTLTEKWVKRSQLVRETSANSAEAKLYLIDNPEIHKWALKTGQLTDDGSGWNEDVLRIDAKYREQDKAYDALQDTQARQDYLKANADYATARLQRAGYQVGLQGDLNAKYVTYNQLPTSGGWRDRYLLANPDFTQATGKTMPDVSQVKPEAYDLLNEKTDRTPAEDLKLKAYQSDIPEQHINNYVTYDRLPDKGYVRERYLQANPEYYQTTWLGVLGNKPIDFKKVPTANVESLLDIYDNLPTSGKQREAFRAQHADLDTYLVDVIGLKPLGQVKKRTTESEFIERFIRNEQLAGIR